MGGMKVWAVVGDPDEAEEIIDYLMDNDKTVFNVSSAGGQFASIKELNKDPSLPQVEVLAYMDGSDPQKIVVDAAGLNLRGILFHVCAGTDQPGILGECNGIDFAIHRTDIFNEIKPEMGLPIA